MVALTSILLPLYIYPTTTTPWTAIYDSIVANPTVTFDIIINPDSGPGSSDLPDPPYITAIAQLNSYPNTNLHGYVHTLYAAETLAAIEANVTKYANWDSYTEANISLAGIFFDESVYAYTAVDYAYMKSLTSFAKNAGLERIIFNPGETVDTEYYALADTIVAFENSASAYSSAIPGWVGTEYMPQSAFIMYGFDGTVEEQEAMVEEMAALGMLLLC